MRNIYDLGYRLKEWARDYNLLPRIKELREHFAFHREKEFKDIETPITYIGYKTSPPTSLLTLQEFKKPKGVGKYSWRYSRLELDLHSPDAMEIERTAAAKRSARSGDYGQFSGTLTVSKDLKLRHPLIETVERLTGELRIDGQTYIVEFVYEPSRGQTPTLTSISKKLN